MATQPGEPKAKKVIEETIETERTYQMSLAHLENFLQRVQDNVDVRKEFVKFDASLINDSLKMVKEMRNISESLTEKWKNLGESPDPKDFSEIFLEHGKRMREVYLNYPEKMSKIIEMMESVKQNKKYKSLVAGYQNLEPCLMSELSPGKPPEAGKIYLEKHGKQLKYKVLSSSKQEVEVVLDIVVKGDLSEFLRDDKNKDKILEIVRNNGHLRREDPSFYLIQPVQRLPRYKLLLEDLTKKLTQPAVVATTKAVAEIAKITLDVNEKKRFSEYLEKLNSKNELDRIAAKRVQFTVKNEPGQTNSRLLLSDLNSSSKALQEKLNKKKPDGVFTFKFVKGSRMGRQARVRAYLTEGVKYTFLINTTPQGFYLTIKQDISKLNQEGISKLFEIAKQIGVTISPQAEPSTLPYSLPRPDEIQTSNASAPTALPGHSPKLLSEMQGGTNPLPAVVKTKDLTLQSNQREQGKQFIVSDLRRPKLLLGTPISQYELMALRISLRELGILKSEVRLERYDQIREIYSKKENEEFRKSLSEYAHTLEPGQKKSPDEVKKAREKFQQAVKKQFPAKVDVVNEPTHPSHRR